MVTRLRPRVRCIDHGAQSFLAHVGVVLCRREIGMSEEFLDGTKVGTAVEQMCRERMAERVRMCGRRRPSIEKATYISGAESRSSSIEEHGVSRGRRRGEHSTTVTDPLLECIDRRRAQGDDSLFAALPPDDDALAGQIEILGTQATHFGHAESTPVEQFENGIIARSDRRGIVGGGSRRIVEYLTEFVVAQHPRKPACRTRGTQTRRRIGVEMTDTNHPREVPAQCRCLSRDRAPGELPSRHRGDVPTKQRAVHEGRISEVLTRCPLDELIDVTSIGPNRRGGDRRQRRLELLEMPRIDVTAHEENPNGATPESAWIPVGHRPAGHRPPARPIRSIHPDRCSIHPSTSSWSRRSIA